MLPGVEYFVKDRDGRFVAISESARLRFGLSAEAEIIGRLDREVHPPAAAANIREDDLRIMKTGRPLIDRLEAPFPNNENGLWFLTTKLPIFGKNREVVGVMGFVRPLQTIDHQPEGPPCLQKAISHIHEHYRGRIRVTTLASLACISSRHLNRVFQATLRVSAREYIISIRIRSAKRELTTTDKSIHEVAVDNGFYDQSLFTKLFRRATGETPHVYRRRRQACNAA